MVSSVRGIEDRILVQDRTEAGAKAAQAAIGALTDVSGIVRNGSMYAFGFKAQPEHVAEGYIKALNIPEAAIPAIGNLLNQAIVVAKTKEALAGLTTVTHQATHTASNSDPFVANVVEQRANIRETSTGIA